MNTEEKLELARKALFKIMMLGLQIGNEPTGPNEQSMLAYEALGEIE